MKCCYSPINAGNMANGRNIKSSHLSHLGTLRKDIKITIKYHKRLEKKVLYIGNIKPQEGVQIHFLYIYSENRALVITIILRHLICYRRFSSRHHTGYLLRGNSLFFFLLCRSLDNLEQHLVWTIIITDDFDIVKLYN